jgi:hypothetical protein
LPVSLFDIFDHYEPVTPSPHPALSDVPDGIDILCHMLQRAFPISQESRQPTTDGGKGDDLPVHDMVRQERERAVHLRS